VIGLNLLEVFQVLLGDSQWLLLRLAHEGYLTTRGGLGSSPGGNVARIFRLFPTRWGNFGDFQLGERPRDQAAVVESNEKDLNGLGFRNLE
jgi:hypothetical protein